MKGGNIFFTVRIQFYKQKGVTILLMYNRHTYTYCCTRNIKIDYRVEYFIVGMIEKKEC